MSQHYDISDGLSRDFYTELGGLTKQVCSKTEQHVTVKSRIDIRKKSRRLAPIVSPVRQGKPIDREGFETFELQGADIKDKQTVVAQEVFERQFNAPAHPPVNQATALSKLRGELAADARSRINRRIEYMTARACQDGKIHVKGEGVDRMVDYRMEASHKVTLAGVRRWPERGTATPFTDLDEAQQVIEADSGLICDTAIFSATAWRDFVMNEKEIRGTNGGAAGILDLTRVDAGEISVGVRNGSLQYMGRSKLHGIDFWRYAEYWHDPETATDYPMFDPGRVVLFSSQADFRLHFFAIQDLEASTSVNLPYHVKTWVEPDPSVEYMLTQSAPLPVLHEIDAVYSLMTR